MSPKETADDRMITAYHYLLTGVYVPVTEFPYPPAGIETKDQLVEYIEANIDALVPRKPSI